MGWGDEDDDEEDFKLQDWDDEKMNVVRVEMGHLYWQKQNDKKCGSAEDSLTTTNHDQDENTEKDNGSTKNQDEDEDANKDDDLKQLKGGGEDEEKSREEYDKPLLLKGGGEEEEFDNDEEHSARPNDVEAGPQTLRGSREGDGKLEVGHNQNECDRRAKLARKYQLSEEDATELAQSKKFRQDKGLNPMNWEDQLGMTWLWDVTV